VQIGKQAWSYFKWNMKELYVLNTILTPAYISTQQNNETPSTFYTVTL
jgi:hypothetical protein